jgi:hypothetical protein
MSFRCCHSVRAGYSRAGGAPLPETDLAELHVERGEQNRGPLVR